MSETSSSPDISFCKSVSLVPERIAFSFSFAHIFENNGVIISVNADTVSLSGTRISVFLKSGTVSCCCVVPVPVILSCFRYKYRYFALIIYVLGIKVTKRTMGTYGVWRIHTKPIVPRADTVTLSSHIFGVLV